MEKERELAEIANQCVSDLMNQTKAEVSMLTFTIVLKYLNRANGLTRQEQTEELYHTNNALVSCTQELYAAKAELDAAKKENQRLRGLSVLAVRNEEHEKLEKENSELKAQLKEKLMPKPRLTISDLREYLNDFENGADTFSRFKERIDEHYEAQLKLVPIEKDTARHLAIECCYRFKIDRYDEFIETLTTVLTRFGTTKLSPSKVADVMRNAVERWQHERFIWTYEDMAEKLSEAFERGELTEGKE